MRSSVKEAMPCGSSGIFPYSRRKPICTCRPSGSIVHATKLGLFGRMNSSDPSNATASFFAPIPSNKLLGPRLRMVLGCSRHRPVPYNACITMPFQLSASGSMSECGKKQKKRQIWFWVSTTLPSKKGIRITPAFTTSKVRRCLTCYRAESWRSCGLMPKSTRDSFFLTRRQCHGLSSGVSHLDQRVFSESDSHCRSFSCSWCK